MSTAHLIFPVGLFRENPHISTEKLVVIVEDPIFFTVLPYHKAKLVLHRASMQKFYKGLKHRRKLYIMHDETEDVIFRRLEKCKTIEFIDPNDTPLTDKWRALCKKHKKTLVILPSRAFLLSREDIEQYKGAYRHDSSFYPWIRRRHGILMDPNGKPEGGRFSFDKENRKRLPPGLSLPIARVHSDKVVDEAIRYVERHFSNNAGSTEHFIYPTDHACARMWLRRFVKERLRSFGPYEDAFIDDNTHPILFHSCLAVSLNIGLLTDREVVNYVLSHREGIPLSSLEGFLRQLVGWKNYIYLIYLRQGEKIRHMNFFQHTHRLSKKWWTGETGMPPVDAVIRRVQMYGYAHHIERLMILGNFMLLCRLDPSQVTAWFQAFVSIDAYDVFMIPNVMGMSQHADGGITMTRPYFSSSAYLKRMGPRYKGNVTLDTGSYPWDVVWDALYYAFIRDNSTYLLKNYSTASQVRNWQKKSASDKRSIGKVAQDYIQWIQSD